MSAKLRSVLHSFWDNADGVTAIEYGMICGGIALAILVAVELMGTNLTSTFNSIALTFG
jgi:pilus assembly protein Flp/PilA